MIAALPQIFASSSLQLATQRFQVSWEWYVIRAAGFVSAGLLILLMLSGIGQVTGLTYRLIEPVKAWMLHKAMAIALCVSLAIHIMFIFFDQFTPFSLAQILLPFLSHYNNGTAFAHLAWGSFAVSFGVLAMYGVVIIVLSSLGWIDTHQTTWRWLHYLSYAVIVLVFLHGLYIGSDLKYGSFRKFWILLFLLVVVGIISRLRRVGSLSKAAPSGQGE